MSNNENINMQLDKITFYLTIIDVQKHIFKIKKCDLI